MNLSEQSKEIIDKLWQLKTSLNQIMPNDLSEYIIKLISRDQAHQKLIELLTD